MKVRGFDERWSAFPEVQETKTGIFELKTGWSKKDLEGLEVLDAGCGIGRFMDVVASWGGRVTGIDASLAALDVCRSRGLDVIEADLLYLQRITRSFDRIYSIGVLHHLASPGAAFGNLCSLLRPGGEIAVWVYGEPLARSDDLLPAIKALHEITKSCPVSVLLSVFTRYGPVLRDVYRSHEEFWPLFEVLRVSGSLDDRECISDTLDWHAPKFRSSHTSREVHTWFEENGLDVIWTNEEFPVSVRGKKP